MIIVRFRVQSKPEHLDEVIASLRAVSAATWKLKGVIHFDIAQDLLDHTALVVTEVFADEDASKAQNALPVLHDFLQLLRTAATGPFEVTFYEGQPR